MISERTETRGRLTDLSHVLYAVVRLSISRDNSLIVFITSNPRNPVVRLMSPLIEK